MDLASLKPLLLDLLDFAQARQHSLVAELSETERDALGTVIHWSARDHVAHLTFWKRRLSVTLSALARSETPPREDDPHPLNAQVFEEQRHRPWPDILRDAEQTHADLRAQLDHLTEEGLAGALQVPPHGAENADGAVPQSPPLWGAILRHGYWHPLEHITQFYLDRDDVSRATQMQQAWAGQVGQPHVPPTIRSIGLYTLALFCAKTKQAACAQDALQQALALHPDPIMGSIVLGALARLYVQTKQRASAQDALQQALALNPDLASVCKKDPDFAPLLGEEVEHTGQQ